MPWQESRAMDARVRFIGEHQQGLYSMVELCARYGVSRKTGYKWLERYGREGASGLLERSRAPLRHGRATPEALRAAIVALRDQRSDWGPRKIVAKLADGQPELCWPSASTAEAILKRAGKVLPRQLRRHPPPRLCALTEPLHANHVWRVDYKGWVRLLDGGRLEPLTMTDGFSRYLISVSATGSTREAEARPLFERAFDEYGLPEVIRSDNGAPFASASVTGLTGLCVWWIKLGIRHERIDPGKPQQNGGHERFHGTLLAAMRPAAADRAAQERRFAAFARDYNEERPHEALGQKPPARFYAASPRRLPARLPEPVYPGEAAVRQVRSNGEIKWAGELVYVSSSLAGEAVGLIETEGGDWQVRFYAQPIGVIGRRSRKLQRLAAPMHGGGEATAQDRK